LVKYLLIVLLIYFVIRMFSRMSFSSFVYKDGRNNSETQQSRKEGSVTLEKNEKSEKIIKEDEGEYIDYEEIK
jgi:hypothetical protein